MGKTLKKLSSFVCRFHVLTLIVLGLLTVTSASLVFKIELKTDIMDLLPQGNQAMDRFRNLAKDFGSLDNLTIVIASKDKKALEYSALAEDIANRLTLSGLVEYADYNALNRNSGLLAGKFTLFLDRSGIEKLKNRLTAQGIDEQVRKNKEKLLSPFASPLETELIGSDPLDVASVVLASLSKDTIDAASQQGYYVSKDSSLLLIMVKPSGSYRDIASIKRFRQRLAPILQEAASNYKGDEDLSIGLAGPYAIAMETNERMPREVFVNAITSTVLVLLLFKFVFRKRLAAVALAAVTLVAALAWTLGAAYLYFGELNMVSSVVTAMLMGLGIDYVVHIFGRCETEYRATGDLRGAIEIAMEKTAPGVVTGALTTSAAFFCIVITSFQGLHNLGIIAGTGVIACLASTLILMPALMTLTERLKKGLLFSDRRAALGVGLLSLTRITSTRPGYVVGASILLITLSAAGIGFLRFDNSPEATGTINSEALLMNERVSRAFNASVNPLAIIVTGVDDTDLMERYERLGGLLARLKKQATIQGWASLERFVPSLSRQTTALGALAEAGHPESIDAVRLEKTLKTAMQKHGFNLAAAGDYSAYAANVSAAMKVDAPLTPYELAQATGGKLRHFYNASALKAAAYVYPNSQNGVWNERELSLIEREVKGLGDGFELTGAPMMFASLKTSIIKESAAASLVSLVLIIFIVYAQFRTIRRTLLVFVPLAAGFLVTLGVMGLSGLNFNFINIAALPLLLGIGIDYGVYVCQDYAETGTASSTLRNIGAPVIMCALTTVAGFGSLATFGFKGIASMGIIISIGVIACLAGSLLLLPAILSFRKSLPFLKER